MRLHSRQIWIIASLELRRAFLSKRSFWVYLLALFPTVVFLGHGIEVKVRTERWAARGLTPPAVIDSIQEGETAEQVLRRAPNPIYDNEYESRRRDQDPVRRRYIRLFDGKRRVDLNFEEGVLQSKRARPLIDAEEDRRVFAAVFQYFYLRLAIFFGCLGIFMNLFRGEMLDKTLHFWLLAPVRREVLLGGKYLAGFIAATTIFTVGAVLCFGAMLWPQDPAEIAAYWQERGLYDASRYAASAALACLGYGSVFLAAGLLVRNPIIPAAVLVLWEGIAGFLPEVLQKFSILYYAQSLCPVPAPMDPNTPAFLKLLLAPAAPAGAATAVIGLLALTSLVLWSASRAVRRIEIDYGGD